MTEASPAITSLSLPHLSYDSSFGSIGRPLPNTEVKVIAVDDSKGTPLGPNQQGELLVRGPQVMKGYFNRPEETPFLDGWLKTGDMISYNEDGFLFISDRLKELIKVKGFQVSIYIFFWNINCAHATCMTIQYIQLHACVAWYTNKTQEFKFLTSFSTFFV